MTTPRHRLRRALLPAVLLVAGLTGPAAHAATATAPAPASSTATATVAVADICESTLPSQADDTIALIDKGGPFPYPQDGTVFQNREGLLPQEPQGYYHEYTVKTPGSSTRGARRVITSDDLGHDGMYWTPDHYSTFYDIDFGC
ncbi:ribonuclease domain-containing protein [Actinomadura montaniterrae]|uniref:Ribonuclease n=1 Tax=Actinomadura montaniterrae TaxID=1803903 RepID=A0A6L3VUU6_9ACTN|nr:ribonuclease domain-containing protein [Actinomadura montaniterrae]KAB2377476.1 ribonuclease [Actinomadura montaniterrae]